MAAKQQSRMMAEWEASPAILITWPHSGMDWPDQKAVEQVYLKVVRSVAEVARLLIVCADSTHQRYISNRLTKERVNTSQYQFIALPSDDVWVRDYGPIRTECDSCLHFLDFQFNGWGNKFSSDKDNAITKALYKMGHLGKHPITSVDYYLEGGALDSDGMGSVLLTRSCLLHAARNGSCGEKDIEHKLAPLLGIKRFLWLDNGSLEGDDTDGHIDMLARFVNPKTILYVTCSDSDDSNYHGLSRMHDELSAMKQESGAPYTLIPLPLPAPVYDHKGKRWPVSYANFLIVNDIVLVPQYGDPADAGACHVTARAFPKHRIIAVDCLPLIEQGGAVHCMTMNLSEEIVQ